MLKKQKSFTPNLVCASLVKRWVGPTAGSKIGRYKCIYCCRWERGTAFPSPHYRQELCRVFEKRPGELGLVDAGKEHKKQPGIKESSLPERDCFCPLGSPLFSALYPEVVGREPLIQQVRTHLLQGGTFILSGLPGIGKTTMRWQ